MRVINSFVITKTDENLPSVLSNSFKNGMVYPYPHVYIFKGDESEEEYSFVRLRPLASRCGNIRDSRLNNNAVGIVLMTKESILNEKQKTLIANIIKYIIEDVGIEKYSIYTDEINKDRFVDVFGIEAKISLAPSSFTRNQNL
jgi:hypothetical protein